MHIHRNLVRSASLSFAILGTLVSCGGGSGSGPSSGSDGPDGPPPIEERYISRVDTRPTLDAIAGDLDPYATLIDDDFHCHDLADPDFSAPDETIRIEGTTYAMSQETGAVEQIVGNEDIDQTFRGGSLDGASIQVSFNSFGQFFSISAGGRSFYCYQQGASAESAIVRFTLASVDTGDYTCRDVATGKDATMRLYDDGGYELGGTLGSWSASDGIRRRSSSVEFTGGALGGATLDYTEDVDNGHRWFERVTTNADGLFDDGQSVGPVTLKCWANGPPLAFAVYGAEPALPPADSTLPIAGRYVRAIDVATVTDESYRAEHFWFGADGRAFRGIPPRAGLDCNRTQPNGLPYCGTYVFDGTTVVFHSPLGARLASYSAKVDDGRLTAIGGYSAVPAGTASSASIVGLWSNVTWWNYGCVGGFGYCDNGYKDRGYAFNESQRFRYTDKGLSTIGVTTISGPGSVWSFGSSDLSSLGSFSIDGTTLTLAYDDGDLIRRYVVRMENGEVAVNDRIYYYKGR
jgi:hypothetical protein